jgi:predicted N-formylglutamate amidohydrolase
MVAHFSIHTFTPVLNGELRSADIGLLYDPVRFHEKQLCMHLQEHLLKLLPKLIVKENYPYRGTDDGLTCALRQSHPDDCYSGIEIEINQKLVAQPGQVAKEVQYAIAQSIPLSIVSVM